MPVLALASGEARLVSAGVAAGGLRYMPHWGLELDTGGGPKRGGPERRGQEGLPEEALVTCQ
jgi:hypothetical protein